MIKKMPTKKLLEDFLMGFSGNVSVYFDKGKGEFIRASKRNNTKLERPISSTND